MQHPETVGDVGTRQVQRKCEIIRVFWDPTKTTGVNPKQRGEYTVRKWPIIPPSMCAFFYNNGWLKGEKSYQTVRSQLLSLPVIFVQADVPRILNETKKAVKG